MNKTILNANPYQVIFKIGIAQIRGLYESTLSKMAVQRLTSLWTFTGWLLGSFGLHTCKLFHHRFSFTLLFKKGTPQKRESIQISKLLLKMGFTNFWLFPLFEGQFFSNGMVKGKQWCNHKCVRHPVQNRSLLKFDN